MENKITRAEGYSKLRELIKGESSLRVPGAFLYSPANVSLFTTDAWMWECFCYCGKYADLKERTEDPIIKSLAEEKGLALLTYVCALKNII